MILTAGLLVLAGLGLFVGGLATGTTSLYWGCVACCAAAAVLLIAVRLRPAPRVAPAAERRAADDRAAERRAAGGAGSRADEPGRGASAPSAGSGAPEGRRSRHAAPEVTAPGGTSPEGTAPEDTAAEVTAPEDVAPEGIAPEDVAPEGIAPEDDGAGAGDRPPAGGEAGVGSGSGGGPEAAGDGGAEPPVAAVRQPTARAADDGDDPAEEDVEVTDILLVVDLRDQVLVVDEHPRYHLTGCRWLRGRPTIPLPVSEARSDGFTPCAVCRPDSHLADVARARRAASS
ncbi:hypothetical protein [Trujillonella humicola]|uniref:hypothetical protein n=1 Tax=Trujillonella humicola TaxID=3383699 RepID=UPI0039067DA0